MPRYSIIVPLYKSTQFINQLIDSIFKYSTDFELICVDDGCPQSSHKLISNKEITVIVHDFNKGFGAACNSGAAVANTDYLIFLNSDCVVLPDWTEGLIDPLSDSSIGIVGNLQLKPNGAVCSCGSEWNEEKQKFLHRGQRVYNGDLLPQPFYFETLPDDLKRKSFVQMVTGCCFSIRKDLFLALGGFDERYKKGYWEDSDLNMRVKLNGKQILFNPESRIIHYGNGSCSLLRPERKENEKRFLDEYVATGLLYKIINEKA